jgi:hypothetical protein
MECEVEAVFDLAGIGTVVVLPATPIVSQISVHSNATLCKAGGEEKPVRLTYVFASGPNVDRTRLSFGVSGASAGEITAGDRIRFDEETS